MKIEIEVPDIKTAADAINNAAILYGDVISCIHLGCSVPAKARPLKNLTDEELDKRFNCLKQIYQQLEAIETKMKEEEQ